MGSLGSQNYVDVKTQRRELEKELCSREDVDVNRPGYAGFTPLNYAKGDIKELLQNVNKRRHQINCDLNKDPVAPLPMADTQSLRNDDSDDPVDNLACLSRSFSM